MTIMEGENKQGVGQKGNKTFFYIHHECSLEIYNMEQSLLAFLYSA